MRKLTACASLLLASAVFAAPSSLRVMTYNIRYDNPADSLDNWKYRRDYIGAMIRFYAPDVFGIQEGLINQVQDLSALLPAYHWSGKARDDGRQSGEFSAIFFRTERFQLLQDGTFWLSSTPDRPSRGWDAALNRIVSWAQLRDKISGRDFFVFNTHFDHQGQTARQESAKLLVQQIRRIARGAPCIVTGDFNSSENEPPYHELTAAVGDGSALLFDALSRSQSAHLGPLKTYSGFDVHRGLIGERIDFVFVSDGIKVERHATLSDFMPNEHFPSDHLPVMADLLLP